MMQVFISILLLWIHVLKSFADIPIEIASHMNTNVSPCEDFYEYACGNWIETIHLKPTDQKISLMESALVERVDQELYDIIESKPPVIGEFWDSCMAIEKINALGNQPLQNDIKRIVNAKSHSQILELMGDFSRTGKHTFVRMELDYDRKDTTTYTLLASKADLTIPFNHYGEDKFSSIEPEYRQYINKIMELAHFPMSDIQAANAVIKIEKAIIYFTRGIGSISDFPHLTIKEATSKWPLGFGAYFKGMGHGTSFNTWSLWSKSTPRINTVQFENPRYFDAMETLLKMISIEELKVYTAFTMIHNRIIMLSDEFLNAHFDFFHRKLHGEQARKPRQWFCMKSVVTYFPQEIGILFSKKTLSSEATNEVTSMTKRIRKAMKQHVSKIEWLDTSTKDEAMNKLKTFMTLVGHSNVMETHSLQLSRDHFHANVNRILLDTFITKMHKVHTTVNRLNWPESPASINAFYSPMENKIVLPAAILQPPMFTPSSHHPARNFGAIGTVIGHEITHGLDTNGRHFDSIGNMRLWWTPFATNEFQSRAQCFEQQYSRFSMNVGNGEIKHVNGKLTLEENIADNGGISLAWDAYRQYIMTFKPETKEITKEEGDQLFFLAFAQNYCTKARDETMQEMLIRDTHSPSKWRVNGVVMNSHAFATVFQCKSETPMNPLDKCKLW